MNVKKKNYILLKARNKSRMGMAFVFPAFIFVFAFMIYPLITSFYYSFTKYNYAYDDHPVYCGIANYLDAFKDKTFLLTIKNTFTFASMYFVLVIATGFFIALLLFYFKGRSGTFRTMIFLPTVVPISLAAILFNWIFAEHFGLLNYFIGSVLGLPGLTRGWLTNRTSAMLAVIVVTIWNTLGFQTILFLSGIQSVPSDILEAAKIDGAGAFQTIFRIILPSLRETFVITGIWAILTGLKVFVQPSVMTGGAPGNSTRVMYMHIYDTAFVNYNMGYASALGFILSAIILCFSLLTMKMNKGKEE